MNFGLSEEGKRPTKQVDKAADLIRVKEGGGAAPEVERLGLKFRLGFGGSLDFADQASNIGLVERAVGFD